MLPFIFVLFSTEINMFLTTKMISRYFIIILSCLFLADITNCKLSRQKRDVAKVDDPLLAADMFEGDIAGYDGKTLTKVADGENLWLNKEIPYQFDELSYVAKRAIYKAMEEIKRKTCIRFRNVTGFDNDYLVFVAEQGCFSYIGKHGGRQRISVGKNCETVGTVLHLLMHALGYWHEQSRLDRDNYILINLDNVAPENKKNFDKYAVKIDTYDYNSITHMSPYAYAIDKTKKTILSKDERYKLGQRLELSQGDINAIVKRYCGRRSGQITEQEIMQNKVHEDSLHESFADPSGSETGPDEVIPPGDTNGCIDLSRKCPLWATQGMCYKQRQSMLTNCPASCLTCDYPKKCVNFNSLCGMWAWMGQCLGKRSLNILKMCPLACGVCLPEGTIQAQNDSSMVTCQDRHQKCHTWATRGRCFYQHIIRLCPSSCQKCPTSGPQEVSRPSTDRCRDHHSNCPHWQQRGFCNQAEYKQKCPMSCRVCLRTPTSDTKPPCRDNNPVLCKYLKNSSDLACLLEITAKSCPKTCGAC